MGTMKNMGFIASTIGSYRRIVLKINSSFQVSIFTFFLMKIHYVELGMWLPAMGTPFSVSFVGMVM